MVIICFGFLNILLVFSIFRVSFNVIFWIREVFMRFFKFYTNISIVLVLICSISIFVPGELIDRQDIANNIVIYKSFLSIMKYIIILSLIQILVHLVAVTFKRSKKIAVICICLFFLLPFISLPIIWWLGVRPENFTRSLIDKN